MKKNDYCGSCLIVDLIYDGVQQFNNILDFKINVVKNELKELKKYPSYHVQTVLVLITKLTLLEELKADYIKELPVK